MTTNLKLLLGVLLIAGLSTPFSVAEEIHIKNNNPNQQEAKTIKIDSKMMHEADQQVMKHIQPNSNCPTPTNKSFWARAEYGYHIARKLRPVWSKYDLENMATFYLRINRMGEVLQSGIIKPSKSVLIDEQLLKEFENYPFPILPDNYWMETTDLVFTPEAIKNNLQFDNIREFVTTVTKQDVLINPINRNHLKNWHKKSRLKAEKRWKTLPKNFSPDTKISTSVAVKIILDKNGNLLHHYVYKSSCNKKVDEHALNSVKNVKSFDPPPHIPENGVYIGVDIELGKELVTQ